MKKITLAITLFIALTFSVTAQNALKKSVGVVTPHNDKNAETFFTNYASVLNSQGYHEAAKYLAAIGGKSFGSCFVVKGYAGHFYAITNRHVVEFADSAKIQFIDGRDTVTYDGLPVIGVSENIDLAAIQLPDGVAFTPLAIADNSIEDGAEVFTAGFPGISGKPSWQFGKGIVSNGEYYNELLTNDSNRWVIQHTAQIDAGSSGGPLLVKDYDEYMVVGVNTWKVSNRDGMNLAINSQDLQQFIATLAYTQKESTDELNGLYQQLVTGVKQGYRNILPHLSYTYMFYMTVKEIDKSFSSMPKVLRDDIDKQMSIGHFTEALRLLSAFNAAKQMSDNPFTYESVTSKGNEVILSGKDRMEVVFAWEKGAWRITKVGRNSSRKQVASSAAEEYGMGITSRLRGTLIGGNVSFPVAGNILSQAKIGGQFTAGWVNRFISYEGIVECVRYYSVYYIGFGARIGGLLPIQVSPHVIISPNIKFELGSDISAAHTSDNGSYFFMGGIGGADFIFKLGKSSAYILLGAYYEHRGLFNVFKSDNSKIDNLGYAGAHIGFIF